MKITSNDKISIRSLALIITQYKTNNTDVIKMINTGTNTYIIIADYEVDKGLNYFVKKKDNKTGKYLAKIDILKVNRYGIEYSNCNNTVHIPASVSNYIRVFDTVFKEYLNKGEIAFNLWGNI